MNSLTRHSTSVDLAFRYAVLALVADKVTALSTSSPPRSHSLSDGYRAVLLAEVGSYIATRYDELIRR